MELNAVKGALEQILAQIAGVVLCAQDGNAVHAELAGVNAGGESMIGTVAAEGDHIRTAVGFGFAQSKLQLAHFVAAVLQTGEVVTLDEHAVVALGETVQLLYGRREEAQTDMGQP